MEVCMKCQQSGINYLKESTIYISQGCVKWVKRHFGYSEHNFLEGFLLCNFSLHVACVASVAPPWGRVWSLYWLASVRIPEQIQYPVNTHNTSPDPSLLSLSAPFPPPGLAARSCPILCLNTASQGESEHTPSQMCVRCLNPNIEKHSTFIIWVSEKFRTFYPLLQSTHICRAKELIVNQFCGLKLTVWIMKINIAFILMYSHCAITF